MDLRVVVEVKKVFTFRELGADVGAAAPAYVLGESDSLYVCLPVCEEWELLGSGISRSVVYENKLMGEIPTLDDGLHAAFGEIPLVPADDDDGDLAGDVAVTSQLHSFLTISPS